MRGDGAAGLKKQIPSSNGHRVSVFFAGKLLTGLGGLHHPTRSDDGAVVSGVCQGRSIALTAIADFSCVLVGEIPPVDLTQFASSLRAGSGDPL